MQKKGNREERILVLFNDYILVLKVFLSFISFSFISIILLTFFSFSRKKMKKMPSIFPPLLHRVN